MYNLNTFNVILSWTELNKRKRKKIIKKSKVWRSRILSVWMKPSCPRCARTPHGVDVFGSHCCFNCGPPLRLFSTCTRHPHLPLFIRFFLWTVFYDQYLLQCIMVNSCTLKALHDNLQSIQTNNIVLLII